MSSGNATPAIDSLIGALPSEAELTAKCLELGLIMRRAPTYDITHPAITLFPSTIPAAVLQELYTKQTLWNEAIDRTARNYAFVQEALRETAASDVYFTGKLVAMLERVYRRAPTGLPVQLQQPVFQPRMLGIFRTDYMQAIEGAESPSSGGAVPSAEQWKNVEINTVSCSFAGLSPLVSQFHAYLHKYRSVLLTGKSDADAARAERRKSKDGKHDESQNALTKSKTIVRKEGAIEKSISGEAIPSALAEAAEAWKQSVPLRDFIAHYSKLQYAKNSSNKGNDNDEDDDGNDEIPVQPVVLVVIQEDERNTGDQYKLLFTLLEQHGVVSIRRTLTQLHASMELVYFNPTDDGKSESEKENAQYAAPPFAVVEKKYVASVVYFRSTYVPEDFPTEACWASRERLEQCNGIKCPSLPHHLLTFKKLQQLFTFVPTVLVPVAFAGDVEKAKSLSVHFMEQYSLNKAEYTGEVHGDPETYIQDAIARPHEYVLKPQLEGGGNLIAGDEMTDLLKSNLQPTDTHFSKIRKEFILMKKIHYEKKDGLLFRQGKMFFFEKSTCSELGIFGCILSDGSEETYRNSNSITSSAAARGKVFNRHAGYVVRTKPADVEDGGVMAGVACLDNMRLL